MSSLLENKRATRGSRVRQLIGEEAENDAAFWGHDTWNESSEDTDYEEEEEKPDEFDQDFNDTETEESDEGEEEEKQIKKSSKQQSASKKKKPAFSEPKPKRKRISTPDSHVRDLTDASAHSQTPQTPSNMARRATTQQKTQAAEQRLKEHTSKPKRTLQAKQVFMFSQEQLLQEGISTEQANERWLSSMKMAQDEQEGTEGHGPKMTHASYTRYLSRRGSYNTITFSEAENVPEVIRGNLTAPEIPPKMCVVTNQPAKYKDPVTNLPFASVAAFRVIRSKAGARLQANRARQHPSHLT